MLTIGGQCHCGNVRYTLRWPDDPPLPRGRACTCSYCRMHGAVWTSHPRAALTVELADPARIIAYRFGHRSATFHVCAVCGLLPFASCTIDGAHLAVTNIHTFETLDAATLAREDSDFEGEDEATRLARRRRNWTPLACAPLAACR